MAERDTASQIEVPRLPVSERDRRYAALRAAMRAGEVTAGVFNRANWWKRAQDWVSDVRDCGNRWGLLVIDRLRELGIAQDACIAISGLGWLARAPDGIVPYATVTKIKEAFPRA